MLRKTLALLAVAFSAGTIGCAHCDTCQDFPAPAHGPAAYGGGTPVFGAVSAVHGDPTSMTGPANDAAPAAPSVDSKPAPAAPAANPGA